jgi:alpha-galactosidase
MYRLISPYEESRAALMYVSDTKEKAVLFCYTINAYRENITNALKLQGLDAAKKYEVKEINIEKRGDGRRPQFGGNTNRVYSGDYLMKVGLNVRNGRSDLLSNVYEISEVK